MVFPVSELFKAVLTFVVLLYSFVLPLLQTPFPPAAGSFCQWKEL